MPTPTYTPLANLTLSSSASSVTFSSISQAYRDLVLVVSATSSATADLWLNINSTSTAIDYWVRMSGSGSSASSSQESTGDSYMKLNWVSTIGTTAGFNSVLNIMDYSATNKHKTILTRTNNAGSGTEAFAGRWGSTSAITTLAFTNFAGTYAAGSTFALYGIAA